MSDARKLFDPDDFPPELLLLILKPVIEDDFSCILSFRFLSRYVKDLLEIIANELFKEFCKPLFIIPMIKEKLPSSSACSFFYYANNEAQRLHCYLQGIAKSDCNKALQPYKFLVNSSLLTSWRLTHIGFSMPDFSDRIIASTLILTHVQVLNFIELPIFARDYGRIACLVGKLKMFEESYPGIHTFNVIDSIFEHAVRNYRDFEFAQLLKIIPANVNTKIGVEVASSPLNPEVEYYTLLRCAAVHGNLDLVKFLVANGAKVEMSDYRFIKHESACFSNNIKLQKMAEYLGSVLEIVPTQVSAIKGFK